MQTQADTDFPTTWFLIAKAEMVKVCLPTSDIGVLAEILNIPYSK